MSHGCYTPTPAVRRLKSDFVYILAFITSFNSDALRSCFGIMYVILFYFVLK